MPGAAEKTRENPQGVQAVFTQGCEQANSEVRESERSDSHCTMCIFVVYLKALSVIRRI